MRSRTIDEDRPAGMETFLAAPYSSARPARNRPLPGGCARSARDPAGPLDSHARRVSAPARDCSVRVGGKLPARPAGRISPIVAPLLRSVARVEFDTDPRLARASPSGAAARRGGALVSIEETQEIFC